MSSINYVVKKLEEFYNTKYGVQSIPGYDVEMGAATFHPRLIHSIARGNPFSMQYIQPCRRPSDGRSGARVNRMQIFHQYQVVIAPRPNDIVEVVKESFEYLGIDSKRNDIEFLEDDWQSPTLGARGLGWEVRINGLESLQYTYFLQCGGHECSTPILELAYGVERICFILECNNRISDSSILDLHWNDNDDIYPLYVMRREKEFSMKYFEDYSDFSLLIRKSKECISNGLIYPAYDYFIKANHVFNTLDITNTVKQKLILELNGIFRDIFNQWRSI